MQDNQSSRHAFPLARLPEKRWFPDTKKLIRCTRLVSTLYQGQITRGREKERERGGGGGEESREGKRLTRRHTSRPTDMVFCNKKTGRDRGGGGGGGGGGILEGKTVSSPN